MQRGINTLVARIEKLNEEFKKAEKRSDEPEMLTDYEFALNDMANIELEIMELQLCIKILEDSKNKNLLQTLKVNNN